MAAAALVSLGDASGFEVLVGLLEVNDHLEASHPAVTVGAFAAATLERYTGETLGPPSGASPEEVAAAAQAWSAWLEQNQASLLFDEAAGTWTVG